MIDFFQEDPVDPLARLASHPGLIVEPNKPIRIKPLSPEREQELLPKIAGMALGGLGYAGSVLEKTFGGRAVRGLLGGKPRELLSIMPFSDTLGITSESDRVSGRDLLRTYGAASKEDNWGNFLAGLGVELATDPGMYLTFGMANLSKGGQIARQLNVLPKTMRERTSTTLKDLLRQNPALYPMVRSRVGGDYRAIRSIWNEPLSALVGFQLPFGSMYNSPVIPLLTGDKAIRVMDATQQALQKIGDFHKAASSLPHGLGYLYRATPVSMAIDIPILASRGLDYLKRYGRSLVDARVMGALTAPGQESAVVGYEKIAPYAAKYRERIAKYAQDLDELHKADPSLGAKDPIQLRKLIEGVSTHSDPRLQAIADAIRKDYQEMLRESQELGIKIQEFYDPFVPTLGYAPRHWVDPIRGFLDQIPEAGTHKLLAARDKSLSQRRIRSLLGFKEGTAGVNELFKDPILYDQTLATKDRVRHIINHYFRDAKDIATDLVLQKHPDTPLTQLKSEYAKTLKKVRSAQSSRAKSLVERADGMPYEFKLAANKMLLDANQQPIVFNVFGHHPLYEMINYVDRLSRVRGQAVGALDLITKHAKLLAKQDPAIRESIPLTTALSRAGLLADVAQGTGAYNTLVQALSKKGFPTLQTGLSDLYLPKTIAADLGRVLHQFDAPNAIHPIVQWGVDYPLNMFRALVTSPWVAFHVRNLSSGQLQNLARGAGSSLQDVPSAYQFLGGGVWKGLENIPVLREALRQQQLPLTDKEATKLLSRLQFAHNVSGYSQQLGREILAPSFAKPFTMPVTLDDVLSEIPGASPKTLRGALNTYLGKGEKTTLNPLQIVQDVKLWAPVAGGQEFGAIIEGVNRIPLYVDLLRRGYNPAEAAKEVLKAHIDYSRAALTPTERHFMRRLFPFYTYTRGIIPEVLTQLGRYPGGFHGGVARIAGSIRQQQGNQFIPSYLGEGLAIPLTHEDPEGMRRFLTRIDLPVENVFELYKSSYGDPIQASIMGLASQMNPMLKGPIEYAMDKQFFSGRELGDLYSITGNYLLDQILFNSPVARFATTFRQITDPRKWDYYALPLNLLTGLRVTDVDINKYRDIAERDYLQKQLKGIEGISKFQTVGVKPEAYTGLTDREIELLQLQRLIEQRSRQRDRQENKKIVIR